MSQHLIPTINRARVTHCGYHPTGGNVIVVV